MNLTANIAGFNFDHILLNAAGVVCQTSDELDSVLAWLYERSCYEISNSKPSPG